MKIGRLLIRLVVGGLFIGHGSQKLFGWFGGPGPDGTEQMMYKIDMHPARRQALAAGLTETAGGALLAAGLATPLAAASLTGGLADSAYNAFVTQIGSNVQAAQTAQQTSQSLLSTISNQRQSVSGVSLDEEMANLIQYQQAYQASARVMNAIDQTLSDLIQTVGSGI